jgi:hypothetical protein
MPKRVVDSLVGLLAIDCSMCAVYMSEGRPGSALWVLLVFVTCGYYVLLVGTICDLWVLTTPICMMHGSACSNIAAANQSLGLDGPFSKSTALQLSIQRRL